jgi:hypothetical protein
MWMRAVGVVVPYLVGALHRLLLFLLRFHLLIPLRFHLETLEPVVVLEHVHNRLEGSAQEDVLSTQVVIAFLETHADLLPTQERVVLMTPIARLFRRMSARAPT